MTDLTHSNWLLSNRQTFAVVSQTQACSIKYGLTIMGLPTTLFGRSGLFVLNGRELRGKNPLLLALNLI
jgi:hypothetical protein